MVAARASRHRIDRDMNHSDASKGRLRIAVWSGVVIGFLAFLICEIIDPSGFGRIGVNPATGLRWAPTTFDQVIGYFAVSFAALISTMGTVRSICDYRDQK